jgi:hypothetical protein
VIGDCYDAIATAHGGLPISMIQFGSRSQKAPM